MRRIITPTLNRRHIPTWMAFLALWAVLVTITACDRRKAILSREEQDGDAVTSEVTIAAPAKTPQATTTAASMSETVVFEPTQDVQPEPTESSATFPNAMPGADGVGDPFYPQLGNGGYDVQHYTIDLAVGIEEGSIDGTTTIEAAAVHDLSAFNLDLFGLEVKAVSVDGSPAGWNRFDSELTVIPKAAIPSGAHFVVQIEYGGVPQLIADPGLPFLPLGWQRQIDGFFAVAEPSGSMNWYPVNNHQTDKATYTFRFTIPNPYMAVANGMLVEAIEGEGETTYVWQATDPMASYLVTAHVGRYELETETGPGGVPIRNYFYEGTPEEIKSEFDDTAEMMAFMSELIAPYPFEAYGVVLLDYPTSWALETQTISTFSPGFTAEAVVFHELMHQWFGNSVSPATWQDVWMNEGFATYFTQLWGEHLNGRAWLDATMDQMYSAIAARDIPQPFPEAVELMFASGSYSRGAWTLHALRQVVGDDTFFEIMRTYYNRYQNSTASTQEFIDTAEEIGGVQAGQILRDWIYSPSVPAKP